MVPPSSEIDAKLVPDRLWSVPIYLPYLQPPLTDRAVEEAELQFGAKLPRAYIAALRIQNGGYIRLDHPLGRGPVSYIAGIGPRRPSLFSENWDGVKQFMEETGSTKPARVDDLIEISGDGHYFYCLDYRRSGRAREPRVTFVDLEWDDIEEVLAPDFATFLRQLRPSNVHRAYGLVTADSMEAVAAAISRASGFSFEEDLSDLEVPRIFRASLPGQLSWAWLTPNKVRRGFVRRSHEEYDELIQLFPELVDRYPEHADCSFFLDCVEFQSEPGQALVGSLSKLPFPSRALLLEG